MKAVFTLLLILAASAVFSQAKTLDPDETTSREAPDPYPVLETAEKTAVFQKTNAIEITTGNVDKTPQPVSRKGKNKHKKSRRESLDFTGADLPDAAGSF